MSNLRRKHLAEHTERYLESGIIENCVIRSVDVAVRKKQDGSFMNMLMFIKISQLDEEGNLFAESEFGINKVTDDNPAWISYQDNVMRTVNQLAEILEQVYSQEDVDKYFDPFSEIGIKTLEEIEQLMKGKPKVVEEFNTKMKDQFKNLIEDIEGLDSDRKFRIKFSYDSKGKYLQIPQRDFIEPMTVPLEDSKIEITDLDLARKAEHAKQLTASKDPSKAAPPVPGRKPPVPGAVGSRPNIPGAPAPKVTSNPISSKAAEESGDSVGTDPAPSTNGTGPLGAVPGVKPPFKKKVLVKS